MEEENNSIINKCICPGCPSYKDCSKEGSKKEIGFCFETVGKSKCITKSKGCLCEGCFVKKQMKFKHIYYCIDGSDKEQSK
jgi:hypothetical protein